jgi:pimeloyl-ACP methyl ester carboxylesterase
VGFTANGPNVSQPGLFGGPPFYIAAEATAGGIRLWQNIDDPALPTCPPNEPDVPPGCAIRGDQVEVTDMNDFLVLQFDETNFVEWYFSDGRVNLDFAYGRDSSALGDERFLAVTQNANVDVPVLAIGGSNGLTPTPSSFASYLDSIATPEARREVVIIPGYAHLDVITASDNAAVPVIADWVNRLVQESLGF